MIGVNGAVVNVSASHARGLRFTSALLFSTEVFRLCTCSFQRAFHAMGQARIETNLCICYCYNDEDVQSH